MSDGSQKLKASGRRVLLPDGRRQLGSTTCCCTSTGCDGFCLCPGTANQIRSVDVAVSGVSWQPVPGYDLTCGDPGWVNRTVHVPALDEIGYTWNAANIDSGCYCTDACYSMTSAAKFVANGTNGTVAGQESCCDLSVCVTFGTGITVVISWANCTGGGTAAVISTGAWDCSAPVTTANSTTSLPSTTGGFFGGSITVTPSSTRPYPLDHTFTNLGPIVGACCGGDAPAP